MSDHFEEVVYTFVQIVTVEIALRAIRLVIFHAWWFLDNCYIKYKTSRRIPSLPSPHKGDQVSITIQPPTFPNDTVFCVMQFLTDTELVTVTSVSRQWERVSRLAWKERTRKDGWMTHFIKRMQKILPQLPTPLRYDLPLILHCSAVEKQVQRHSRRVKQYQLMISKVFSTVKVWIFTHFISLVLILHLCLHQEHDLRSEAFSLNWFISPVLAILIYFDFVTRFNVNFNYYMTALCFKYFLLLPMELYVYECSKFMSSSKFDWSIFSHWPPLSAIKGLCYIPLVLYQFTYEEWDREQLAWVHKYTPKVILGCISITVMPFLRSAWYWDLVWMVLCELILILYDAWGVFHYWDHYNDGLPVEGL